MTRKGQVTPGGLTVTQAKVGIVVGALFLLFGLVFCFVVMQDMPGSEGGERLLVGAFFLIWTVACIGIIIGNLRIISRPRFPGQNSLVDFSIEDPGTPNAVGATDESDFATRLRRLEELKRDGLISDVEYRDKRAQILGEKW